MGTRESERRADEMKAGWLPIEQYIETIPHSTIHAAFYFTDETGRPFGMRSSYRADNWQFPGGDMDHGDVSPFAAAVRELAEETGMEFSGEPTLLATLFRGPGPAWPGCARIGFLFDGGVLTQAQLAGIRLDPGEHDEWAVSPLEVWRTKASRVFVTCLDAAEQARATGRAAFLTA